MMTQCDRRAVGRSPSKRTAKRGGEVRKGEGVQVVIRHKNYVLWFSATTMRDHFDSPGPIAEQRPRGKAQPVAVASSQPGGTGHDGNILVTLNG